MPPKRNYKAKRYRKRVYKSAKKTLGKTTAKAVKAIVKSQMRRVIETKNADYADEPLALNCFYHNQWRQIDGDPFYTQQGTEDSTILSAPNRIGDSIYSKNIWRRLLISKFADRANLVIRIVILKVKAGMSVPADITNNPQLLNRIIAPIDLEDPSIMKVMYDRTFVSNENVNNGGGATVRDTKFMWNHNHRTNEKVAYDGGDFNAKKHTYKMYVCCYDTQSSLSTDNVARYSYYRRHHFEDA